MRKVLVLVALKTAGTTTQNSSATTFSAFFVARASDPKGFFCGRPSRSLQATFQTFAGLLKRDSVPQNSRHRIHDRGTRASSAPPPSMTGGRSGLLLRSSASWSPSMGTELLDLWIGAQVSRFCPESCQHRADGTTLIRCKLFCVKFLDGKFLDELSATASSSASQVFHDCIASFIRYVYLEVTISSSTVVCKPCWVPWSSLITRKHQS